MLKNFSVKALSFASTIVLSSLLAGTGCVTSSFAMFNSTDDQIDWNSYTNRLKLPEKKDFAAILDMAEKVVAKGYYPPENNYKVKIWQTAAKFYWGSL